MKVILNQSHMNLGEAGQVVNVKPGYARNYLLPKRIALSATPANLRLFQDKAKEIEARRLEQRSGAEKLAQSLKGLSVSIKTKASEEGKLFGSISARDIQEELAKKNAVVDRSQIVLSKPIKMVGDYTAKIRLVGRITVEIPVKVESDSPSKRQMREEAEEAQSRASKTRASKELKAEVASEESYEDDAE